MRIVHIITETDTGGAETMLLRLVSETRGDCRNVVISLKRNGAIGSQIEANGIKLYSLSSRTGFLGLFSMAALVRILREEKPDILQTWLYHADFFGLFAAKIAGVKNVLWNIRSSCVSIKHFSLARRFILRLLALLSSTPRAVASNSYAGVEAHKKIGYHPRRWCVIPNGFPIETFCPAGPKKAALKERYFGDDRALLVGCVARLDPLKDHANFLSAIKIFKEKLLSVESMKFVFIGSGVDNGSLSDLARSLGIEGHTVFWGERRDIAQLMGCFDVYTSSSVSEGFPNSIGEAMACGVPCVATDAGDSARLIGDTGMIVPVKDPEALARAWQKMIMMGQEARQKMGAAARERIVSDYSIQAICGRYEALYADVLSR